MEIASKAWSDFASHIPLIRSFSLGNNFPPQYPLFSGPLIRYHFLFYALVGLFEKYGLRIDYALNIPSALGFSFLILLIYLLSKEIFKSKAIGILSILFILFNGSLEFIKFLFINGLSKNLFFLIVKSNKFFSFGPYDGSTISAFWNLNIYTNQRHLAASYALCLFIVYVFIKYDKKINLKISLGLGLLIGILFFLNMAVFLMTIIILITMSIFVFKKKNYSIISIFTSLFISLPFYFLMQSKESSNHLFIHIGYLVNNLSLYNFLDYWVQNLGLHTLLIFCSLLILDNYKKRIFLSFFMLFIIGNLFQFSPEIAANHKFFNLFMIIGVMYSSYLIYYIYNKKVILRPLIPIIIFFLIFSGVIDFFPILNDTKISLPDYTINKDISWIIKNTNPNSIFLNSQYLYDNASIAGRKIFLGWPYFAWSQGYDTSSRDNLRKKLLSTENISYLCNNSRKYHIDYIETEAYNANDPNQVKLSNLINYEFKNEYQNKLTNYKIYSINQNCNN
ncbi:MAG TPA: hypothetical protein VES68_00300 [Candidatus Sulfotelmatobacter sp.]|nr:hypothetical protein [Candidatus Sulfotelmatobacter sp.]